MGVRQRKAHKHSKTHIIPFAIAGFFGFLALLMATLLVSLTVTVNTWLEDLPDYKSADAYLVPEPTTLFAADGSVMCEYYLQNRRTIDIDQVNDWVIKATIDTEDIRFYQHNGVDPVGIVRAIIVQMTGGSEGASTITQQLVRNTVLSDEQFEYSIKRKVREAYVAIQMEKMYTKEQILMMYLNTIFYGDGCYGIQAASINYFNKNASDLSLAEAALLCGLPQAPSAYNPFENPELALKRRNIVLDRMHTAGDITDDEYNEAINTDLNLNHGAFPDSIGRYPYFSDYVRELLLQDFDYNTIMQGGLKVYTTLDPRWQRMAEDAVQAQLEALDNEDLQCGLVALDPASGWIKALVGGRDYNISQYNTATQAYRQVGSTMKMFTVVTAIRMGMSPTITINGSSPMIIGDDWEVQNYGGASYGYISLRTATSLSVNTVFAQVAQTLGIENVIETAHMMGIDVDIPPYPSICLGTIGIPVVQMAEAYSVLPADGVHRDAIAIYKIEDRNGNVIYEHQDNPQQVLDPAVAEASTSVMESVLEAGGGSDNLPYEFYINQPMAGKTGTTEEGMDLWYCGYTPTMCCAVWCGYLEHEPVYIYGGSGHPWQSSVRIWGRFAQALYEGEEWHNWPDSGTYPNYLDNYEWSFSGTPLYSNKNNWYDDTSSTYDDTTSYNDTTSYDDGTTTSEDTTTYDDTATTDGGGEGTETVE